MWSDDAVEGNSINHYREREGQTTQGIEWKEIRRGLWRRSAEGEPVQTQGKEDGSREKKK
jgi:hypothetical protein